MRRLLPFPVVEDVDLDGLAAHFAYPSSGQTVRANMVSSLDGAIALDGHSRPISSDADWYLFGLQRALADVIVVGAGTARAEGYGPGRSRPQFAHLRRQAGQAPAPTLALVTRTGELEPDGDYLGGDTRAVVITCARGRPALEQVAARTDVIECGDDDVDLGRGLDALGERGFLRVLTEGGPHLLGSLVDAGRLDELVTSLSPAVVGGDAGRMVAGAAASLRSFELTGVLEDEGTLFLHHRARRHERP